MDKKTDKKGFVMYLDYKEHFKLLSDEQLGKLLRIIYEYQETGIAPEIEEGILQMAFSFIRLQLDRDKEKYESEISKRKAAGKKGAESKWGKDTKDMAKYGTAKNEMAKYGKVKNKMAKMADTDTVTVTDTVTDTDIYINIEENSDAVAGIKEYYIRQSGEKNPPAAAIHSLFQYSLSVDMIEKAIEIALSRGHANFDYINGILKDWNNKGFKKIDDIQIEKKETKIKRHVDSSRKIESLSTGNIDLENMYDN